jgi:ribonuclease BN (tRNA processing enzyme)
VDIGYATLPRLLEHVPASSVDAVVVSHGHPDHCADLNPLLRVRALSDSPPAALPVYALPGALDAVLALDRPRMLDSAYRLCEFSAGSAFEVGPFRIDTWALPHFLPNAGIRLSADGHGVAYTGDTGPSEGLVSLARGADLFIAEATYADEMDAKNAPYLSSARQAGEYATRAGVGRLLLTHLWPEEDPAPYLAAARLNYDGAMGIAGVDTHVVELATERGAR